MAHKLVPGLEGLSKIAPSESQLSLNYIRANQKSLADFHPRGFTDSPITGH
jgi:hypothetical protein